MSKKVRVIQKRRDKDPMIMWQKKYAAKLTGWDVVKAIRKMRDGKSSFG